MHDTVHKSNPWELFSSFLRHPPTSQAPRLCTTQRGPRGLTPWRGSGAGVAAAGGFGEVESRGRGRVKGCAGSKGFQCTGMCFDFEALRDLRPRARVHWNRLLRRLGSP